MNDAKSEYHQVELNSNPKKTDEEIQEEGTFTALEPESDEKSEVDNPLTQFQQKQVLEEHTADEISDTPSLDLESDQSSNKPSHLNEMDKSPVTSSEGYAGTPQELRDSINPEVPRDIDTNRFEET